MNLKIHDLWVDRWDSTWKGRDRMVITYPPHKVQSCSKRDLSSFFRESVINEALKKLHMKQDGDLVYDDALSVQAARTHQKPAFVYLLSGLKGRQVRVDLEEM